MDIEELITILQNPGDDGPPETIYDDLRTAHTSALDGASSKIEELNTAISERDAEIDRLKSANWDLFEQIPKAGDSDGTTETDATEHENDEATLDDLIVDDKE